MTSISLFSCLVICSSGWLAASTTIVMRERSGFSVGPTARDSMLNPRRLNSAETRASTPDLFSTSTDSVWRDISDLPFAEDRADVARGHDVVVAGTRGDHRPHLGVVADHEVDDHRRVVDGHRLLDHRVDVVLGLAAQPDAAQRLGEGDEVGDAHGLGLPRGVLHVQLGVGVAALVEEGLPLPDHPEVAVVDHGALDRDALDRAGGQLLVGHLEAAVAVDGPDRRLGPAVLGAHGGRDRVAHRAEAAAVEPGAGLLVPDELGRPHLVLPDARGVDAVGAGDGPEPLDHVLRRAWG